MLGSSPCSQAVVRLVPTELPSGAKFLGQRLLQHTVPRSLKAVRGACSSGELMGLNQQHGTKSRHRAANDAKLALQGPLFHEKPCSQRNLLKRQPGAAECCSSRNQIQACSGDHMSSSSPHSSTAGRYGTQKDFGNGHKPPRSD